MSPSLKKVCIFGLATGLGRMLLNQSDDAAVLWRAEKLSEAGQNAIDKCLVKIDNNMLRRAGKKIDQVCMDGERFDVVKMLSFLFLGLTDLEVYCSDTSIIEPVRKRALWFTRLFDPKLEDEKNHSAAMRQYEEWVGSD